MPNPTKPRYPDCPRHARRMREHRGQGVILFPTEKVMVVHLGCKTRAYPANTNAAQLLAALSVRKARTDQLGPA